MDPVTFAADLEFVCPRCGADVEERFYGPCSACRLQMGEQSRSEGAEIEVPEYEPKMNVTPNAVATKD